MESLPSQRIVSLSDTLYRLLLRCYPSEFREGDILVLCTDGLNKAVSDAEIRSIVEQYPPEESVDKLVELANQQSGEDNVTAIVVRVSQ